MPAYDYRCAKSGETFEVQQSFSDKPLTKHPGCGGKVSKVLGAAGIVLKGSGFYKNDSGSRSKTGRKEKSTAASSGDSGSGDSGGSKDGSSTDSSSKDGGSKDGSGSGGGATSSSSDSKSSDSGSSSSTAKSAPAK
jgi:putative FmdB family regulatory protein